MRSSRCASIRFATFAAFASQQLSKLVSPWRAHGFGDASCANCWSFLKCVGSLPSHQSLPEAVTKNISPGVRSFLATRSQSAVSGRVSGIRGHQTLSPNDGHGTACATA